MLKYIFHKLPALSILTSVITQGDNALGSKYMFVQNASFSLFNHFVFVSRSVDGVDDSTMANKDIINSVTVLFLFYRQRDYLRDEARLVIVSECNISIIS